MCGCERAGGAPRHIAIALFGRYALSPISIVVQQDAIPLYKFITSTCAIIGGVFTVIGFLENIIHHSSAAFLKKQI